MAACAKCGFWVQARRSHRFTKFGGDGFTRFYYVLLCFTLHVLVFWYVLVVKNTKTSQSTHSRTKVDYADWRTGVLFLISRMVEDSDGLSHNCIAALGCKRCPLWSLMALTAVMTCICEALQLLVKMNESPTQTCDARDIGSNLCQMCHQCNSNSFWAVLGRQTLGKPPQYRENVSKGSKNILFEIYYHWGASCILSLGPTALHWCRWELWGV